jgi:transposase-like protein
MPKIDRLSRASDWIELDFVEKRETPPELMKLGIHLHLAGLSLADTTSVLERFDVPRARATVHNWVQKANVQPAAGYKPAHVAVDETVIHVNNERHWLYAAVDPATNRILHAGLYTSQSEAAASLFLGELREKHAVEDAVFLVDGAPWLHAACHRYGLQFQHETYGDRNSAERVFKRLKRRTNQFSNHFRNANVQTVETWLLAYCALRNQPI